MTDTALTTPNEATRRQIEAADPRDHVWVSANAGSGKTRVLTDRVARLLLDGVPPQNVLCLTYTKAAASEMQNRLFKRLGQWAMLDDAALAEDLRALGVRDLLDAARLGSARRLFARAIETPGGLRIQTIHAFCASLLRRFPLEAGISPQFQEMDDRAGVLLREEIADEVARTRPDLMRPVADQFTGERFDKLIAAICRHEGFGTALDDQALADALGAKAGATVEEVISDGFPLHLKSQIAELSRACAESDKVTDQKAAVKLAEISGEPTLTRWELDILMDVFLNGAGATVPFSAKIGKFPTKDTRAAHVDLMADIEPMMEAVEDLRVRVLAQEAYHRSLALHGFGREVYRLYSSRKARDARLDFDDLIHRARALLNDPVVAQWVLFKLDGGIDHILVDEAQDTSPEQWDVIRRLTEEFASGEGARTDIDRTLFVVGDKKQSIYSFQGADPEAFDRMREHFDNRFAQANTRLSVVPLEHSFRSSAAVLQSVDETFVGPAAEGVETDIKHIAFKGTMPGRVDLWPVQEAGGEQEPDPPWFTPLDRLAPKTARVLLSETIAARIKQMIEDRVEVPTGEVKDGKTLSRAVTEGDFLILVRGRSGIFPHLIRACKEAGLNVAGADRLKVGGELAVKDLAALMRFLALPEDDLSLACALKSPLFGWDEQALFTLAHHRPEGQPLWEAMRKAADQYSETMAILDDLRKQADFLRPFDLIDRVLNRWEGRKRLLARLGEEAEDGIDAFLSQALAYEQNDVPSLTGFVGWMQSDDVEIKRQLDAEGDRLRIMTVHGAKGLEAPIVILPECAKPVWRNRDEIVTVDGQPVWKPVKEQCPPKVTDLLQQKLEVEQREWRRLLYVAMTRAESWLIVAAEGKLGAEGESWHRLVEAGLERLGAVDAEMPTGPGRRFETGDWGAMTRRDQAFSAKIEPVSLPGFQPVTPPERPATLSPSDLGGAKVLAGEPSADADGEAARIRGTVLHRLLEHLPNHPEAEKEQVARALVSSDRDMLPVADAEGLIADAMGILADQSLAPLFAPGTLAEATISAEIRGQSFLGAIDRLVITDGKVLAVDYKSNRLIPDAPDQVPEGLLRQMGAYHAMMGAIWPDREIEVAILWTGAACLMPLPAPLVSAALDRVSLP